jgi:hypothetical protein
VPIAQGNQNVLNFYMVPSAPGKSRFMFDAYTKAKGMPLMAYLVIKHLTVPWIPHLLTASRILDGDTALLHWQVTCCGVSSPSLGNSQVPRVVSAPA